MNNVSIALADDSDETLARANSLAESLNISIGEDVLQLLVSAEKLELVDAKNNIKTCVELTSGRMEYRRSTMASTSQPLLKALACNNEAHIIDATAGMGRDTFLIALTGCKVTAIERSPVMAALLSDGLLRAKEDAPEIVSQINLIVGDAKIIIPQTPASAILIDPMFPQRQKKALVKKEMRLAKALVGDDPDSEELLEIARQHCKRVVVKRPKNAPELGGKPSYIIGGRSIRYDVYMK